MINILLLENIHQSSVDYFNARYSDASTRFNVIRYSYTLGEEQLIEEINKHQINVVGIRSKTNITANVINSCESLKVICCFCIGTNQVDLKAAQDKAIPVFNSPYMNTRSVAELVISHVVALSRQTYLRNYEMHEGFWCKTSNKCHEIRGKKLGIIGYGHVGSQVSILAEQMGMDVIYYDIAPVLSLGNAQPRATMKEVMEESDYLTIHVPLSKDTHQLITDEQLGWMKQDSFLINTSRGTVVDLDAFRALIESGKLAGGAIDVYPEEPKKNNCEWSVPLKGLRNVILTPHIGGATEEAQSQIGRDVAQKICDYFDFGSTGGVVNLPEIVANALFKNGGSVIVNLHSNLPGYLSKINNIFEKHDINIERQTLSTYQNIGYLLIRIAKYGVENDKDDCKNLIDEIQSIPNTIRTFMIK